MKKQTKADKFDDLADVIKCINEGKKVKRIKRYKDGSIPTKPVIPCPNAPEKDILKQCLEWLKKQGIKADRHDAGTFQNSRGQWGTYGIKGAGDLIGLLPSGRHFEIECKAGKGGKLSKGQQKRQHDINENNGIYLIVHSLLELQVLWKKYAK